MWNIASVAFVLIEMFGQHPGPKYPPSLAGIDASHRYTVERLVQDVFVGGACRNTFNIKGIGNAEPVNLDDVPFLNWDLPTTLVIGYRFGK